MKKDSFILVGYKYINVRTIRMIYYYGTTLVIKFDSIPGGSECEKYSMLESDAQVIIDKVVKGRLL